MFGVGGCWFWGFSFRGSVLEVFGWSSRIKETASGDAVAMAAQREYDNRDEDLLVLQDVNSLKGEDTTHKMKHCRAAWDAHC